MQQCSGSRKLVLVNITQEIAMTSIQFLKAGRCFNEYNTRNRFLFKYIYEKNQFFKGLADNTNIPFYQNLYQWEYHRPRIVLNECLGLWSPEGATINPVPLVSIGYRPTFSVYRTAPPSSTPPSKAFYCVSIIK
jgi:hypothetical protein